MLEIKKSLKELRGKYSLMKKAELYLVNCDEPQNVHSKAIKNKWNRKEVELFLYQEWGRSSTYDAPKKEDYVLVFSNTSFLKYWIVTGNNATEIELLNLRNKHKSIAFRNLSTLKEVADEISSLTLMIFSKYLNLWFMLHDHSIMPIHLTSSF